MSKEISIFAVGDLILDEPAPIEKYFDASREVLKSADVLIGHVETPHTNRSLPSSVDIQAPPSNPEHLKAMVDCGFDIASVAGNHLYDCGPYGVIDTVSKLRELGITPCGGGANIDEAKAPAIIEKDGITIGVLSYNLTGPRLGWAMSQKAGCNYVDVQTYYYSPREMPGAAPRSYTFILPEALEQLQSEVSELRKKVDIVAVAVHKGNGGNTPKLDTYEQPFCYAAIDAGADIIIGHHHHRLKGVEVYKGKPIFHGLGNYVTVTYAMTAGHNTTPEMLNYLKLRAAEGRGDGHYETDYYPWDKASLYTMIAKVIIDKNGVVDYGFIPALIDSEAAPHIKTRENGGDEVLDFIVKQNDGARLGSKCEWSEDGTWVRFR